MGHEIVVYRGRHMVIHDMDLWAIRHFLLNGAEASGNSDLAAFVRGWDWVGPGVYLGLEFDLFLHDDEARECAFVTLLRAAQVSIQSFGEFVPLDYLAANVSWPQACFADAQPVERWVKQIAKLEDLFDRWSGET